MKLRLALALGKTLKELIESMSREEWLIWIAYNRIEPIPEPWLQTGIQCSTLANVMASNKSTPEDFMPVKKVVKVKRQTSKQIGKCMAAWQRAIARRDKED